VPLKESKIYKAAATAAPLGPASGAKPAGLAALFAKHGISLEDSDDDAADAGASTAWWSEPGATASTSIADSTLLGTAPKLKKAKAPTAVVKPLVKQQTVVKAACTRCGASNVVDESKSVATCKYCAARFPIGASGATATTAVKGDRCACGAARKGQCFMCG
jgi:DNA-directed RNA polymerase subunit RPC12/RpoP